MATPPVFVSGAVLTAAQMNKIGMWEVVNETTFSAASSVSLPTSTFTSDWPHYRILMNISSATSGAILQLRMRASGTDNTTSNYWSLCYGYQYNAGDVPTGTNLIQAIAQIARLTSNATNNLSMDIMYPQTTDNTYWNGVSFGGGGADTRPATYFQGGAFVGATQFDSVSFIPSTGTITGKYSVYGYR